MLKEKVKGRQEIRKSILLELYRLLHSGGPEPFTGKMEALVGTPKELFTSYEKQKAFHYLREKKFVTMDATSDESIYIFLTAEGIDCIEHIILSEND